MLLAVDIGNSDIFCGVFKADGTLSEKTWRIRSIFNRTSDEYYLVFKTFIEDTMPNMKKFDVIVSSVVPPVHDVIAEMFQKYYNITTLSVKKMKTYPIELCIDYPEELGADRIVNAVAASYLYPNNNVIIVDFGTATTVCFITAKKEYMGGAISPGVGISAECLTLKTAQLPKIRLQGSPPPVIGKNTVDCMRSGIILGYAGLVEGLIKGFIKECKVECKIIATGGLMDYILPHIKLEIVRNKNLTLSGLKILWDFYNKKE